MSSSYEDVYTSVYSYENLWQNDLGSGLWNNKTICLLGFDDRIQSCKDLVVRILGSIVSRGANVVKYPNRKIDFRRISVSFYLCNYSIGFEIRPPNSLDHKLVTPIWLYTCNRDNKIYFNDSLPIFRANNSFNCLKFAKHDLKVSIFGSVDSEEWESQETLTRNIKYNSDLLRRFISHCGFSYLDPERVKDKNYRNDGKLYLLFCKTVHESIDERVLDLSLQLPCLSIEWLFDSYLAGEIREIKGYLVSLQRYETKSQLKKKKPSRSNYVNKVLCFSYSFALENGLDKVDLKEYGAIATYVVNPVYVLAPWALKTSNPDTKKTYNNISLVEENKLILFISKSESNHHAMGLFGELSLLVENTPPKLGKNLVRSIKIYNSFNMSNFNFLEVPFELLEGNKLNVFEGNRNVNLYDLADSITFVDVDNLSQYQDDYGETETTQEVHELIDEFSKSVKDSEMRWLQISGSE